MADRIVKPDSGNDLVLQNDDASAKIEINEAGTVVATPSIQVDNIKIDANTISTTNTNGDLYLAPNGTGTVQVDNIKIDANTVSTTNTDGDLYLAPNGTGTVAVSNGLKVDTDTLWVNATNERVGINKNPLTELHVGGTVQLEDKYFTGGHTRTSSLVNINLGNDATHASGNAMLQIKNLGNRGAKGHANGSDLLRGDFSDANGFVFDKSGNLDITGNFTATGSITAGNLVGMIAPFAMATPPDGWLACDGSAVSRTTYADLFTAIGTTWGAGDGSSTFDLPDLEGAFLRGTGSHGSSTMGDGNAFAGPSVGSFENDQIQRFKSELRSGSQTTVAGGTTASLGYSNPSGGTAVAVGTFLTDGYGTPRTGDETRPFNAGVKFCIKY